MCRWGSFLVAAFLLSGCWMFEKTDNRPAPIVDAVEQAVDTFQTTVQSTPPVPVPGVPPWAITVAIAGGGALATFISVLIQRGEERRRESVVSVDTVAGGS